MVRKAILVFSLLTAVSPFLGAGDTATFINLGFSEDSRYFMFGQYGISDENLTPYADCYIIDVTKNIFAPKGVFNEKFPTKVEPGHDAIGAMVKLIEKNLLIVKTFNINHLLTGRIVYVLIDGQIPLSSLEFRDFTSGTLYSISLSQTRTGSGRSVSSSFGIEVTATTKSGARIVYKIGRPDYSRKGVSEYRIKYILLAPDGKSLVFVIEKSIVDGNGENIRYMVETKRIDGP